MPALRKENKRGRAHRGALDACESRGSTAERREGWKATENHIGWLWANVVCPMHEMQTKHDGSRATREGAMHQLRMMPNK